MLNAVVCCGYRHDRVWWLVSSFKFLRALVWLRKYFTHTQPILFPPIIHQALISRQCYRQRSSVSNKYRVILSLEAPNKFGKSIPEFGETHSSVFGCERRPVSASIMSRSCFESFPVCVYKFSRHYLNKIILIYNSLGHLATESSCIMGSKKYHELTTDGSGIFL